MSGQKRTFGRPDTAAAQWKPFFQGRTFFPYQWTWSETITAGFLLLGLPQRHTPTHPHRNVSPGSGDGINDQQQSLLSLPSTRGDGAATRWKERGRNSPGGEGGGGEVEEMKMSRGWWEKKKSWRKMTGRWKKCFNLKANNWTFSCGRAVYRQRKIAFLHLTVNQTQIIFSFKKNKKNDIYIFKSLYPLFCPWEHGCLQHAGKDSPLDSDPPVRKEDNKSECDTKTKKSDASAACSDYCRVPSVISAGWGKEKHLGFVSVLFFLFMFIIIIIIKKAIKPLIKVFIRLQCRNFWNHQSKKPGVPVFPPSGQVKLLQLDWRLMMIALCANKNQCCWNDGKTF